MDTRQLATTSGARLLVGVLVAIPVGIVLGRTSVPAALLAAWACAAIVFVGWTWVECAPMGPDETAAHATREIPANGLVTHLVVIGAALVALAGVAVVLFRHEIGQALPTIAVLASVVGSWAAVHTVYALRYARLFHTSDGGIDFHMAEAPRYTDFAYVAVTVGMSFAISDTDLASSLMRRVALVHAMLSYLFGTVIIALLVNLVASV